jgi:hypothetical protein
MIGAGISSGVSSQAKPNINPWSPAPCSAVPFALPPFSRIDPCEMSRDCSVMMFAKNPAGVGVKNVNRRLRNRSRARQRARSSTKSSGRFACDLAADTTSCSFA